jgi:hypothetical protein
MTLITVITLGTDYDAHHSNNTEYWLW